MHRLLLIWNRTIRNTENSICRLTRIHHGMSHTVVHIVLAGKAECAPHALNLRALQRYAGVEALAVLLDIGVCVVKKKTSEIPGEIYRLVSFFAIINT